MSKQEYQMVANVANMLGRTQWQNQVCLLDGELELSNGRWTLHGKTSPKERFFLQQAGLRYSRAKSDPTLLKDLARDFHKALNS